MENELLKSAIEYSNRGWRVFPTREKPSRPFKNEKGKEIIIPIKAPYNKGGFKNATLDKNQIREWWRKYPNAGIGVSCGESNLVVLDIDVRDGKRGFDSFASMKISDEGALHSITASGGLHLIYSGKINSHANVKAGVDVRSIGAYFILPPSFIFENGERLFYKKVGDWNKEPAQFPKDLEEKLDWLRGKDKKQNNQKVVINESSDKTIARVKKALNQIPLWVCDEYFHWINVGLALKTLGDDGFYLWKEWSKKSSKYDEDGLEYRWERFSPSEIGLGTIFRYARKLPSEKPFGE